MPTTTAPSNDAEASAACCTPLGAPSLSDDQAQATARLFKALADPHRVRILNRLATSPDPVCVCELTGPLGISQPTVSHHLKKLVQAGLLGAGLRGRAVCRPGPRPAPRPRRAGQPGLRQPDRGG
jgi:ArsR family transcriptional regulator, arsenate/arsenite/antimonite-responsive transcriptional repressor